MYIMFITSYSFYYLTVSSIVWWLPFLSPWELCPTDTREGWASIASQVRRRSYLDKIPQARWWCHSSIHHCTIPCQARLRAGILLVLHRLRHQDKEKAPSQSQDCQTLHCTSVLGHGLHLKIWINWIAIVMKTSNQLVLWMVIFIISVLFILNSDTISTPDIHSHGQICRIKSNWKVNFLQIKVAHTKSNSVNVWWNSTLLQYYAVITFLQVFAFSIGPVTFCRKFLLLEVIAMCWYNAWSTILNFMFYSPFDLKWKYCL